MKKYLSDSTITSYNALQFIVSNGESRDHVAPATDCSNNRKKLTLSDLVAAAIWNYELLSGDLRY